MVQLRRSTEQCRFHTDLMCIPSVHYFLSMQINKSVFLSVFCCAVVRFHAFPILYGAFLLVSPNGRRFKMISEADVRERITDKLKPIHLVWDFFILKKKYR